MNETSSLVRPALLYGSQIGMRLFRNNVGALQDRNGQWVQYGLCKGSSDIIGWTPTIIQPDMVGRNVAIFTAFETKVGKRATTVEQGAFIAALRDAGGIAAVVLSLDDIDAARTAFK